VSNLYSGHLNDMLIRGREGVFKCPFGIRMFQQLLKVNGLNN